MFRFVFLLSLLWLPIALGQDKPEPSVTEMLRNAMWSDPSGLLRHAEGGRLTTGDFDKLPGIPAITDEERLLVTLVGMASINQEVSNSAKTLFKQLAGRPLSPNALKAVSRSLIEFALTQAQIEPLEIFVESAQQTAKATPFLLQTIAAVPKAETLLSADGLRDVFAVVRKTASSSEAFIADLDKAYLNGPEGLNGDRLRSLYQSLNSKEQIALDQYTIPKLLKNLSDYPNTPWTDHQSAFLAARQSEKGLEVLIALLEKLEGDDQNFLSTQVAIFCRSVPPGEFANRCIRQAVEILRKIDTAHAADLATDLLKRRIEKSCENPHDEASKMSQELKELLAFTEGALKLLGFKQCQIQGKSLKEEKMESDRNEGEFVIPPLSPSGPGGQKKQTSGR